MTEEKDLPKGWTIQHSKRKNKVYYFNEITGEASWNFPLSDEKKSFKCSTSEMIFKLRKSNNLSPKKAFKQEIPNSKEQSISYYANKKYFVNTKNQINKKREFLKESVSDDLTEQKYNRTQKECSSRSPVKKPLSVSLIQDIRSKHLQKFLSSSLNLSSISKTKCKNDKTDYQYQDSDKAVKCKQSEEVKDKNSTIKTGQTSHDVKKNAHISSKTLSKSEIVLKIRQKHFNNKFSDLQKSTDSFEYKKCSKITVRSPSKNAKINVKIESNMKDNGMLYINRDTKQPCNKSVENSKTQLNCALDSINSSLTKNAQKTRIISRRLLNAKAVPYSDDNCSNDANVTISTSCPSDSVHFNSHTVCEKSFRKGSASEPRKHKPASAANMPLKRDGSENTCKAPKKQKTLSISTIKNISSSSALVNEKDRQLYTNVNFDSHSNLNTEYLINRPLDIKHKEIFYGRHTLNDVKKFVNSVALSLPVQETFDKITTNQENIGDGSWFMETTPLPDYFETFSHFENQDIEMIDVSQDLTEALEDHMVQQDCNNSESLYIVVDTNILMGNLSILDMLKDCNIKGYGLPIIYVPWIVLQELDNLKASKKGKYEKKNQKAVKAVTYLYNLMTNRHPRLLGQTVFEAMEDEKIFNATTNDDKILQCCIQLFKKISRERVLLWSDDKNLNNKAMINQIKVYTTQTLEKEFFNENKTSIIISSNPEGHEFDSYINNKPTNNDSKKINTILSALKPLLKSLLEPFLRKQFIAVYEDLWLHIACRKPPWALIDILYCYKKHWIALDMKTFFEPCVLSYIEKILKELFNKKDSCFPMMRLLQLLDAAQGICCNFEKRFGTAKFTLDKLSELRNFCINLEKSEDKTFINKDSSAPCVNTDVRASTDINHIVSNYIDKQEAGKLQIDAQENVLKAFNFVWSFINDSCGVLMEVLGYSNSLTHQYNRPAIIPTSEEILVFLPKFYVQLQRIGMPLERIVLQTCEPSLFNSVVQSLGQSLYEFAPSLNDKIERLPFHPITSEMLLDFFQDPSNFELLKNGYNQLKEFSFAVKHCMEIAGLL